MKLFVKIFLIILSLIYFISPVDIISDFIPAAGWLDDGILLALLIYFLKYGKLPNFFFKQKQTSSTYQDHTHYQKEKTYNQNHSQTQHESRDNTPWKILGIEPGSDLKEIQTAYRKAAQTYHPDKVSHLGPEFQELAKKKFVEIQDAYQELSKAAGH